MHIVRAVFRVAVCSLLAAPATAQARPFADADIAAITALNQKWAAAQVAGNIEGILAPLTADFLLMPPNEPVQTGIPATRAWVEKLLAQVTFTSGKSVLDEVIVGGDWACARDIHLRLTAEVGRSRCHERYQVRSAFAPAS